MARNNRRREYADTGGYENPLKPSRPSKPNRPSRETGGDRKPPRPTPPPAQNPAGSEDDSFYTHPGTVGIVNPVKPPAPAEEEEAPVYTYTPPPSPTPSPTPSPVTISETPQQTAQQTAVPATGTPTPLLVKPPQGNISQAEREGIATSPTPTAPGTSGYFYRPTPAPAPTPEASFTTDGGRSDADAYSYASERQAERQLQRSEERDRQAATPTGFDRFRQNGRTGSNVIQTLINSFAAKPPGPEALRERTDAFVRAANPPGAVLPARLSDPDDDSFYTHPGVVGTVNTQGAQAPINTVNSTAVNPATPVQPPTTPFGQSPLRPPQTTSVQPPPAQAEVPAGATYQWNRTPDGWLHPTKIALDPRRATAGNEILNRIAAGQGEATDEVWDGKVPEGAQVFKPAYGQTDENGNPMKGIKLPYRPEGYTEEELKYYGQLKASYGNSPYKFYGGPNGFEGYYYHNGKYYPIDAKKAAEYFGRGRAERAGGGGGHGGGAGPGGNANSGSSGSVPGKIQELDQYYNINKNWSF